MHLSLSTHSQPISHPYLGAKFLQCRLRRVSGRQEGERRYCRCSREKGRFFPPTRQCMQSDPGCCIVRGSAQTRGVSCVIGAAHSPSSCCRRCCFCCFCCCFCSAAVSTACALCARSSLCALLILCVLFLLFLLFGSRRFFFVTIRHLLVVSLPHSPRRRRRPR